MQHGAVADGLDLAAVEPGQREQDQGGAAHHDHAEQLVDLEGGERLGAGDVARLRSAGRLALTASAEGCELLAWEMHAELRDA